VHRLAIAIAGWAMFLSLPACRHYEYVTDSYAKSEPPDSSAPDRPAGRPDTRVSTGGNLDSGGGSGSGGTAEAGAIGPGTGGSAGTADGGAAGNTGTDARAVMPPPSVDAAPPPPDAAEPPVTLSMGLISRWKLDEGSGPLAYDSGGNANIGTVSGATWQATGFPAARYANPGCLGFDGVDDFTEFDTRNLPANNRPQTVAFWVNFTEVPAVEVRSIFFSLTAGAMGSSRLKLGFKEGKLSAWRSGTPIDLATATAAPPPPGWHHYAYTFDGTTNRLYLDGMEQATSATPPDTGPVLRARLASNYDNADRFTGQIDDVRIYGRALSPAEILALYNGFE
jgi:hypothetical protein